ncbi:MAG: DUF3592 domain-containing protein [Pseudomonadota bacterium]|nr:DUF3592 domain-containing protein [Pseudomonadota bacterium]
MPNGIWPLIFDQPEAGGDKMPSFYQAPSRVYLFSAAACLVVALLACLMMAFNALEIIRARDAVAWVKAEAVVMSAVVKSGCARGNSYYAEVRYRYAVAGQDYDGRRVSFGDLECGAHEKATSIIERFPEGARVAVYYDPAQVDESSLLVGEVTSVTWTGIFVGVVLFLASIGGSGFLFWMALKRRLEN